MSVFRLNEEVGFKGIIDGMATAFIEHSNSVERSKEELSTNKSTALQQTER